MRVCNVLGAALLVTSTLSVPTVSAEAPKPFFVLSVASQQRMWDVLNHIGGHSGDGAFVESFSRAIATLSKVEGFTLGPLEGVDKDRPWGMTFVPDGDGVAMLGFLPITDEAKAIASFAPVIGTPTDEDGVKVATPVGNSPLGNQPLYLKAKDGWLFGSSSKAILNDLPDPLAVLDGQEKTHFLAIRIQMQNASEAQRQAALGPLGALMAPAAAEGAATDPQAAFEKVMSDSQQQVMSTVLTQSEKILFGINVDKEKDKILGDVKIVPLKDSTLAVHLAKMASPIPSRFAHLASPADPLTLHVNLSLEPDQVARMNLEMSAYQAAVANLIVQGPKVQAEEEREVLGRLLAKLFEAGQSAMDQGQLNIVFKMTGKRTPYSGLFAVRCGRTEELSAAIEELVNLAKNDPGFTEVKLDAEKVGDVRVHSLTLAQAKDSPEIELLQKNFKSRRMFLAVGPDCLCVGVGPTGLDLVKKALQNPGGDIPHVVVVSKASAMIPFITQLVKVDALQMALPIMSMNLTRSAEGGEMDDYFRMTVDPKPEELNAQFEMGNGFLRVIGTTVPLLELLGRGGSGGGGGGGLLNF